MKLANIMLAIGGGRDNTIPKYGVTAGEIAVLRAIHGDDAVFDVEPTDADALNEGGTPRTNRQELARLKASYGKAADSNGTPFVESLYPGAAARVFEDFDELGLPEVFFKAVGRVAPTAPAAAKAKAAPKDKSAKPKAEAPAAPAEDEDDADGIEDMPAEGEGIFR